MTYSLTDRLCHVYDHLQECGAACGWTPDDAMTINDALAAIEHYETVLRWFVSQFPCPEIHASIDNRPGRCPENSDDPEEWCASARFQRALAATNPPPAPAP